MARHRPRSLPHRCPVRRVPTSRLLNAAALLALLLAPPSRAATLAEIHELEQLINATGTETVVSPSCPAGMAGHYEVSRERRRDRLTLCSNTVDLSDLEAVWEAMAHEATHVMQACVGGSALRDEIMPRAYRELRAIAPHYTKLLDDSYSSGDRRQEAEAFWMELQDPALVLELLRRSCAPFLR